MDMTLSKKDIGLLIGLFGVIVAVLVYYFVYMPYTEKTTVLENENRTLETRVNLLQALANQRDDLIAETKEKEEKTLEILERFPADVREEDIIMLAVQLQNEAPYEYVTGVQIGLPVDVYTVPDINAQIESQAAAYFGTTAQNTQSTDATATAGATTAETVITPVEGPESLEPGEISLAGNYVLKSRTADITAVTTYEGFKNAIRMITERNDRTQLSVMASYDIESGLVDSDVSLVTNYMGGTGKQYVAPVVPFVQQGTESIFGTVALTVSEEE